MEHHQNSYYQSLLFTQFKLKSGIVIKNRIAKAALAESLCESLKGDPLPQHLTLYKKWAEGGVGLIITGHCLIDRNHRASPQDIVIDQNSDLSAFQKYAQACKTNNTIAIVQINHAGRQTPNSVNSKPKAPSSIQVKLQGPAEQIGKLIFRQPQAMTVQEINETINKYAFAAKFCQKAGFDGVEIHAAHGYLISEFLSPKANQRTDEWGGSLENRSRFLLEVIKRIKQEVDMSKQKFIIGLKINSADFQQGGFTEEESSQLIKTLDSNNDLDFIELSGGNYENPVMSKGPSIKESTIEREGYFQEFSVQLRKYLKNTPLMVTGGFRSKAGMTAALNQGIDLIGVGRPFCIEPDFPYRMQTGTCDVVVKYKYPEFQSNWHQLQLKLLSNNKPADLQIKYTVLQNLHYVLKYNIYYYPPLLKKLVLFMIIIAIIWILYKCL